MTSPPPVAHWFQEGFHAFLRRFLKRNFHTVAVQPVAIEELRSSTTAPLIIYGNHPSWWDPLVAHFLCRHYFAGRQFYAPIDAIALAKYPVFKKLGFYGIELASARGAAEFLKTSLSILQHPGTSLWITPEGHFTDVRDHNAELMPGLAHLCTKLSQADGTFHPGHAVPLALEYVFWEERLPECCVRFGEPIVCGGEDRDKAHWQQLLDDSLRATQRRLAADVIARNPDAFVPLLSGARGAGGFYDSLRRLRSWATGRRFRAAHGSKFN